MVVEVGLAETGIPDGLLATLTATEQAPGGGDEEVEVVVVVETLSTIVGPSVHMLGLYVCWQSPAHTRVCIQYVPVAVGDMNHVSVVMPDPSIAFTSPPLGGMLTFALLS